MSTIWAKQHNYFIPTSGRTDVQICTYVPANEIITNEYKGGFSLNELHSEENVYNIGTGPDPIKKFYLKFTLS